MKCPMYDISFSVLIIICVGCLLVPLYEWENWGTEWLHAPSLTADRSKSWHSLPGLFAFPVHVLSYLLHCIFDTGIASGNKYCAHIPPFCQVLSPSFSHSDCPSETKTQHISVSWAVKCDNSNAYLKWLVSQPKSYNVGKGFTWCLLYINTWYPLLELDHGSYHLPLSLPKAFPSWAQEETEDEFPRRSKRAKG